jgi:hypothetical protein
LFIQQFDSKTNFELKGGIEKKLTEGCVGLIIPHHGMPRRLIGITAYKRTPSLLGLKIMCNM